MNFGHEDDFAVPTRRILPLLPLRDIVVFPHMVMPLFVGRKKSIAALNEAMSKDKEIVLAAQEIAKYDSPEPKDIFEFGCVGHIVQMLKLPDGTVKVLVEGRKRTKIKEYMPNEDFFLVYCDEVEEYFVETVEVEALMRSIHGVLEKYMKLNKRVPQDLLNNLSAMEDPSRLADTIAAHLNLKLSDRQRILETVDIQGRLNLILNHLHGEIEVMQVERKIKNRVKKQVERSQKEYYLNEQMRAIQKELGDRDDFKGDLRELEERVAKKKMSKEATKKIMSELKKLKMMSPMSAEATVVRNYIDTVISLPWFETAKENPDIDKAEAILNEDHYGLEKPKQRIVEYLAVNALVGKIKGPILCFVGPPGVGKTSIGKSIGRATGRPFVRLSLGGVRDEAEIRGHRRTYIGSLPGKIIQSLRKAGASNPVFLLDEVDKLSHDYRGDPASALLEVLDPEQNHTFNDHYLDLDYDLSNIMFVTTANTLHSIPEPLQDRMEIIQLPGYTEAEKFEIAKRFLVQKQFEANGVADKKVKIADAAIVKIIREYTREAGVRNLEREIASICRKAARFLTKKGNRKKSVNVTVKNLHKYIGVAKYRYGQIEECDMVGLAMGLAWTNAGGEILPAEVVVTPGKGKIVITGKLGEVMQESAQAALSYIRSRAGQLGIDPAKQEKTDVHIHIPEGAIPKDGPSAGITIATSIASALTGLPVRRDLAMTGEITLRGRVMPIGGLKEKLFAAQRGQVKTVLVPAENEKELSEVPSEVTKSLEIIKVWHMDEVLKVALVTDDPNFLVKKAEDEETKNVETPENAIFADQAGELI